MPTGSGFGSIHALFTCRQPGFLLNDSDDALWQELKQERFTTPLLRGWLPYVRKELEISNLLDRCHTLDCTLLHPDRHCPPTWTRSSSPGSRTARLRDSFYGRWSSLVEAGRAR